LEKSKIQTIVDIRSPEDIISKAYDLAVLKQKFQYVTVPIKPWTVKNVPPEVNLSLRYAQLLTEESGYGFYEIFPRYFQKEICQVFKYLVQEKKPILVHCTLGKDRTGCIVALMEKLLNFSDQEIISDYMNSGRNTSSSNILVLLRVVEEVGGIHTFLLEVGLTEEDISTLKREFGSAKEL